MTGWPDGAVLSGTTITPTPLPSTQQPPAAMWTLSKYASSAPALVWPPHSSTDKRACVTPTGITIWRDRLCQPLTVALTSVVAPKRGSVYSAPINQSTQVPVVSMPTKGMPPPTHRMFALTQYVLPPVTAVQ